MKYKLFLVFVFLFISSCTHQTSPPSQTGKDVLELEKLSLEVDQLKLDQSYYLFNKWIGIIGGLLGGVAILWTIFEGFRTLKNQSDSQKQSQISDLLSKLSEERENVRIGAARGLSRYVEEVVDDVISALRFEESPIVRGVLEEALENANNKDINLLLEANSKTISERISLLGRLIKAGAHTKYAYSLLGISDYAATRFSKQEYRYLYDASKNLYDYETQRLGNLGESIEIFNQTIINKAKQSSQLATSTADVISRLLRNKKIKTRINRNLDLSASNLYRVELRGVNLSNSIFINSVMRHIDLEHAVLVQCDFSGCTMVDANIKSANFRQTSFLNANLRNSNGENAIFVETDLTGATLSEGIFDFADFSKSTGYNIVIRGVKSKQTIFDECSFKASDFKGSSFRESSFVGSCIFKTDFTGVQFIDSCLENAKLNGCVLKGTKFTGSKLNNVDFSGADIRNADFRGADISGAIFKGAKNSSTAKFDIGITIIVE